VSLDLFLDPFVVSIELLQLFFQMPEHFLPSFRDRFRQFIHRNLDTAFFASFNIPDRFPMMTTEDRPDNMPNPHPSLLLKMVDNASNGKPSICGAPTQDAIGFFCNAIHNLKSPFQNVQFFGRDFQPHPSSPKQPQLHILFSLKYPNGLGRSPHRLHSIG